MVIESSFGWHKSRFLTSIPRTILQFFPLIGENKKEEPIEASSAGSFGVGAVSGVVSLLGRAQEGHRGAEHQ